MLLLAILLYLRLKNNNAIIFAALYHPWLHNTPSTSIQSALPRMKTFLANRRKFKAVADVIVAVEKMKKRVHDHHPHPAEETKILN